MTDHNPASVEHGEAPAIYGTARGYRAECLCGRASKVVGTQLLAHYWWVDHVVAKEAQRQALAELAGGAAGPSGDRDE